MNDVQTTTAAHTATRAPRSSPGSTTSSTVPRAALGGMGYGAAVQMLEPGGALEQSRRPEQRSGLPRGEENPFDAPGPKLELSNKRFAGDSKLAEVIAGKTTVKAGASGPHVRKLQAAVEDLGHALPDKHADGKFGGETADGVRHFQEAEVDGTPATGEVDQPTMQRLDVVTPSASDMRHEWRETDVEGRREKDKARRRRTSTS